MPRRPSPSQPGLPREHYTRPPEMDPERAQGWARDAHGNRVPAGFPDPDDPIYGINALRQRLRAEQDAREDAWAGRTHLSDVRSENKAQAEAFKAARRGQSVESDDPEVALAAEEGERYHRYDRRVSFMTGMGRGLGAFARGMARASGGARGNSVNLARATRRRRY